MKNIFEKIDSNTQLNYDEAIQLLSIDIGSKEYYTLLYYANEYSRKTYDNKSLIFAQIGINAAACNVNCTFCKLAMDNFHDEKSFALSEHEIENKVTELVKSGANEIFLMSTAEYKKEKYLDIGKSIRKILPHQMRMVANVGDFDVSYAQKLKDAGFTGVYHICRLGEGTDTCAQVSNRILTLEAIRKVQLEMYYCVEPIGPEHSNQQIVDEIFRGVEYNINVMAVMRRVNFKNSPMQHFGEISAQRLALICAVTTLCVRPKRAMGVHEPEIISLLSGANQIYAEAGSNPRDISLNTEQNRGFSVKDAQKMLIDAQWNLTEMPNSANTI